MSKQKEGDKKEENKNGDDATAEPDYCFVIMPITDPPSYEPGHFARVYKYIIRPACINAGLVPVRADEVSGTNMIVIDILQKIINSKMAVCDLSGRNPNVLYELGIRQSFDLPVTLIKDDVTDRIFDIQGFRAMDYKKSLRYDEVTEAVEGLTKSLLETMTNKGKDVNSIIELLGISKATIKEPVKISGETEVILNAIKDVSQRVGRLETPDKAASTLSNTIVTKIENIPVNSESFAQEWNKKGYPYKYELTFKYTSPSRNESTKNAIHMMIPAATKFAFKEDPNTKKQIVSFFMPDPLTAAARERLLNSLDGEDLKYGRVK